MLWGVNGVLCLEEGGGVQATLACRHVSDVWPPLHNDSKDKSVAYSSRLYAQTDHCYANTKLRMKSRVLVKHRLQVWLQHPPCVVLSSPLAGPSPSCRGPVYCLLLPGRGKQPGASPALRRGRGTWAGGAVCPVELSSNLSQVFAAPGEGPS